MRLSTIWTLRGMALRERLNRTGEWACIEIAAHLPERIKYWTFILYAGKRMTGPKPVPEVTVFDVLEDSNHG